MAFPLPSFSILPVNSANGNRNGNDRDGSSSSLPTRSRVSHATATVGLDGTAQQHRGSSDSSMDFVARRTPHVMVYHLKHAVQSTQDEMRRLLHQYYHPHRPEPQLAMAMAQQQQQQQQQRAETLVPPTTKAVAMAVLADIQLAGRGTRGRSWERGHSVDETTLDGNLYLTVALPFEDIPVTVTLLPLQIAVLVADRVAHLVQDACRRRANVAAVAPKVTVKWPNDVLIDNAKVSGTLIEHYSETISVNHDPSNPTTNHSGSATLSWLLVGIGVNVASAPQSFIDGPSTAHSRRACCIRDVCAANGAEEGQQSSNGNGDDDRKRLDQEPNALPESAAQMLGIDLAVALTDWVYSTGAAAEQYTSSCLESGVARCTKRERDQVVLDSWKPWAEFGKEYVIRNDGDHSGGGGGGETVVTVDIEKDGQLRVLDSKGRERLLLADYLV
jgi:biotin-(acetyl-CoA carboxylase) ligase